MHFLGRPENGCGYRCGYQSEFLGIGRDRGPVLAGRQGDRAPVTTSAGHVGDVPPASRAGARRGRSGSRAGCSMSKPSTATRSFAGIVPAALGDLVALVLDGAGRSFKPSPLRQGPFASRSGDTLSKAGVYHGGRHRVLARDRLASSRPAILWKVEHTHKEDSVGRATLHVGV